MNIILIELGLGFGLISITVNDWSFVNLTIFIQSYKQNIFLHLRYTIDAVNQGNWSLSIK